MTAPWRDIERDVLQCRIVCCRYLHRDVLQRAVRQVRDAADVRLLSQLGARLGLQEEGYFGRN